MINFKLEHFLGFIGDAVKDYHITNGDFPVDEADIKSVLSAAQDYSHEIVTHLNKLNMIEVMGQIKLENKELNRGDK